MAGTILYKLSLDSTQFQTGLNNAMKSLDKAARQMQKVGESMSKYITAPLVAMATVSVMAWDKQAKAQAQVEAGLRSTGNAAGFTKDQLFAMASELQNKTLFGDEEILQKATAQLLTFTNVAGEQFAKAQMAAMNLATRLDGDLKMSAIMVGKALNDPIKGLTAMGKAGVQFTETQKGAIKALWETGQAAAAQNMILAELEKQYGGSAEAAVIGAGKIVQLKNSVGDLMEEFGRIIMDYITPFIDHMRDMIKGFQGLDEGTKRTIVVIAGLAAAIGPVLFIFGKLAAGIALAGTAMAALSTGAIAVLILGLGLAGTAIYNYINKNKELTDSVSKINASIVSEKSNLDFLFGSLKNSAEGTQTRKTAINQINEKYGKYLNNLLTEKSTIEDIERAQKKATTALLASITIKASEKEIQAAQLNFLEKRKSIIKDIMDDVVGKKGAEVAPVVFSEIEDALERIKESGSSDEFKNIAGAFARQFRNADKDIGTYTENLQQFAKLLGFEAERDKIISQIESFRDSYIKKFDLGSDVAKVINEGNKEIATAMGASGKGSAKMDPMQSKSTGQIGTGVTMDFS
ncbi:MAG: phage tail length tape measure family protein, partial [Bacteroidota bacterium]|nr:phage tail length tape measure family protein [Bacteroidota bacterium]